MKKILVALDGSPRAERSIPWVKLLGAPEMVFLQVVEPVFSSSPYPPAVMSEVQDHAETYLTKLARQVPSAKILVRLGSPASTILDVAEDVDADAIALTTRGGSKTVRRILGRTAERLMHGSRLPLLVVPPNAGSPVAPIRRMIVPLDGSKIAEAILPHAVRLASLHGAEVVLVHALARHDEQRKSPCQPTFVKWFRDAIAEQEAKARHYMQDRVDDLSRQGVPAQRLLVHGYAPNVILEAVRRERADLIVMCAHGYGAIRRMWIGSVASQVVRESTAPVLVLKYAAVERSVRSA